MRWQFGVVGMMAALAGGCSLLLDNGAFVGDGADAGSDAGMRDGGEVDGGPPDAGPDAPSAPVLVIAPETPRTLDDLVASITTESVDPLDEAVTYEWAWEVDGADAAQTTETVPSESTRKHETWTAFATPVTSDGRRGLPGSASVTVKNTPPRIRTVGLSTYRPVVGDLVTAMVDGVVDDDPGDSPILQYLWTLDGTDAGVSGSRFSPSTPPDPGQELAISVVADDGDDFSLPVAAGPALYLEDVTRWIQHLPNRAETDITLWDQRHGRMLVVIAASGRFSRPAELWEYLPDREQWVRLRPSGTIPNLALNQVFQDTAAGKMYFIGGIEAEAFEVFELDVSQRGSEAFRQLDFGPGATLPPSGGGVQWPVRRGDRSARFQRSER